MMDGRLDLTTENDEQQKVVTDSQELHIETEISS